MPVVQLTISLVAIIVGFIVLIFAAVIAFRFRIREAGYYAGIQTVLLLYSIVDLVYRRGEFFGWVLTGKTPIWFEHILYIILMLSIFSFEMFFRYAILKEKKPVFLIVSLVLSIAFSLLLICPLFIDAVPHVPLGGFYFYELVFMLIAFLTVTDMIVNHRKIKDPRLSRTVLIFAIFILTAIIFNIVREITGDFFVSINKISGENVIQPVLFIVWNIVILVYANHYFTAKTFVFPVIKISMPKMTEEFQLTERESEIVERLCMGHSNREIGEKLFISELTVKTHVQNIYHKLGVKNRLELLDKVALFEE